MILRILRDNLDIETNAVAKPTPQLISALQSTIRRLEKGENYQWGHMGRCNCGLLAKEISKLSGKEIHEMGMEKPGDWATHSAQYCPTSGFRIDNLIGTLISAGLAVDDLIHLERLDDSQIINRLPGGRRYLQWNFKEDLIVYLSCWLEMLVEQWLAHSIEIRFLWPLSTSVDQYPITDDSY